jgi:hypothetical protein
MNEPTSENAVPMVETPQEQWFGNGVFAAHATDGSPNIAAHSHHLADNGPYSCKEEWRPRTDVQFRALGHPPVHARIGRSANRVQWVVRPILSP